MITTCFRTLVVCLLLASFLMAQADLPLARAAVERAAATGEKCAPHQCCCSPEKRERGTCCCSSAKTAEAHPVSGQVLRAACCGAGEPQSEALILVKLQVILSAIAVVQSRPMEQRVVGVPDEAAPPRVSEPPDPPPRLLSS